MTTSIRPDADGLRKQQFLDQSQKLLESEEKGGDSGLEKSSNAIEKIIHLRVAMNCQNSVFRKNFQEVDEEIERAFSEAKEAKELLAQPGGESKLKTSKWGFKVLQRTPDVIWDELCQIVVAKLAISADDAGAMHNASIQRKLQHMYTYVVRTRTPVVFLISMFLFFGVFTGGLMQMFCVFFGSVVINWKEKFFLFMLPLAIVAVGMICEQMVHLVYDAFDYPPLTFFQAVLATFIKMCCSWKKKDNGERKLEYVHDEHQLYCIMFGIDIFMWFCMVGIPWGIALLRMIQLGFKPTNGVEGYVYGCIISSAIVTLVQLGAWLAICEVIEYERNRKMKAHLRKKQGKEGTKGEKGLQWRKEKVSGSFNEWKQEHKEKGIWILDHFWNAFHIISRKSTAQKIVEGHLEAQEYIMRVQATELDASIRGRPEPIDAIEKYRHFFSTIQSVASAVPVEAMGLNQATRRFSVLSEHIAADKGMYLFQMPGYVQKDKKRHYMPVWVNLVVFSLWALAFCGIVNIEGSASQNSGQHIANPMYAGAAVLATVFVISWVWHLRVRAMIGVTYGIVVGFLAVLAFSTLASGHASASLFVMENMKPIMTDRAYHNMSIDLPISWQGARAEQNFDEYPLCRLHWGADTAKLSPLDLAVFAFGVYEQNTKDNFAQTKKYLKQSFPHRNVTFVNGTDYFHFPRWMHFRVQEEPGKQATSVFAIKGTSTRVDLYFDTAVYNTITMLRKIQNFLPVLMILPRTTIQWMLDALSFSHHMEDRAFAELEETAKQIMHSDEYKNDEWVVTGHSLGGMFAQITSSRLQKPSLVWSSPGVVFSKERMGIQVQGVKRNVVVIVPDHDAVPHADLQAGVVQRIECREKDGSEMANPLACHGVDKSACEIWRVCGDPTRDYSTTCSKYVSREWLGKEFATDDVGSF